MKRFFAAAVIAAVVVSSLPAVAEVASVDSSVRAKTNATTRRAPSNNADLTGTWVGRLPASDVAIAVISDGDVIRAYACDGGGISAWFEGERVGDSFSLRAPDGSTITGALRDTVVDGVFTSADAPITGAFTAEQPTGTGGVFRSHFVEPDGAATFIRWIVFDDDTQRGNAETTKSATGTAAPTTETKPAPALAVPAARTEGTAPVGPAAAPAPVTELTPQSITAPVPTTQLTGAPPPIPPPAPATPPPLQPITVSASVTPTKVDVGTPTRYELTLTNPNRAEVTGAGVGVGLPPSLAVVPGTERSACKGTFVAFPPGTTKPGQPSVVVSGVPLAAGASCTAGVDINATAPTAVEVVTDAPIAAGAPAGVPARATFVFGSTIAVPVAAPPSATTTTTRPPPTTTTTKPPAATTTTRAVAPTTTATSTTAPRASTADAAAGLPSAPRNLRARDLPLRQTDEVGRVEFTFDPPANNGGSIIVTVGVTCATENGATVFNGGPASPITVSGFSRFSTYQCHADAFNFEGERSPLSDPVRVVVRLPSQPRNVRAQVAPLRAGDGENDGRVEVTFDSPADDGGAPIVDFEVACVDLGRFEIGPVARGLRSPIMVGGLRLDARYGCGVRAFNGDGEAGLDFFIGEVVVHAGAPSPPRSVQARALPLRPGDGEKDGRVEVTFDPPESDGGAPILNVLVECFSFGTGVPEEGPSGVALTSPVLLSGFTVDVEYFCQATAMNTAANESVAAPAEGRVVVFGDEVRDDAPSPPRNVRVRPRLFAPGDGPNDGEIEVRFDPPADSSADIVDFRVACILPTAFGGGAPGPTSGGPSSPLIVEGFTVDVEYACSVDAIDLEGRQSPPATFAVIVPGPGRPSPPRNVQVQVLPLTPPVNPGDPPTGDVRVTFDPPADDGGSPIVSFGVECQTFDLSLVPGLSPGPLNGGPSSPIVVSRLTLDVEYVCEVDAINFLGEQSPPAITSAIVRSPDAPSAPRNVRARALPLPAGAGPNDGSVEVSFDRPVSAAAGEPLVFDVRCFAPQGGFGGASPGPSTRGASSPIVVRGFTVGLEHQCLVDAVDEKGRRGPPVIVSVTVPKRDVTAVLSPPRNVRARGLPFEPGAGPNGAGVEVSFDPPASDGGAAALLFEVECSSFPFGLPSPGPTADTAKSPVTLTGFTPDVLYECAVVAFDVEGPRSDAATATVTVSGAKPLAAPTNVRARPLPLGPFDGRKDGRVEVSFDPPTGDDLSFLTECDSFPFGLPSPGPAQTGGSSVMTLRGFEVGVEYECRLRAFGALLEEGPAATFSVTVPGPKVPSVPRNVRIRPLPLEPGAGPEEGRVEVLFDPPETGGTGLSYVVQCEFFPFGFSSPGPAGSAGASPLPLSGFRVDVEYDCTISAFNEFLEEGPSATASVTVAGAAAPSEPRNVELTPLPIRPEDGPDDGRVEVSFDPPATNGGVDLGDFGVECFSFPFGLPSPGPLTSGPSSPLTLGGFRVGEEYTCQIYAVNRHDLRSPPVEKAVTVPGIAELQASVESGTSPLGVTFALAHPPRDLARWELDFGDGSPPIRGAGQFREVPHTFLNKSNEPMVLDVTLRLLAGDESREVDVINPRITVHPVGTVLAIEEFPNQESVRRGGEGSVTLTVGNPNRAPVAGPLTVIVSPTVDATLTAAGWNCVGEICVIDAGLDAFTIAPPLTARFRVPPDAPATFELPVTASTDDGASAERRVRVPVVGVVANAGPDQTVDATTVTPDGSLVPTQVLLDGIESNGLEGAVVGFAWAQVDGRPRVELNSRVDPTGRVVTFDAPSVSSSTRLEFELTLTEGKNISTDRVAVTIQPRNAAPVLRAIDVSGLETATRNGVVIPRGTGTLTLKSDASDPDGDELVTTWDVLTNGVRDAGPVGTSFSLDWPVAGVAQVIVEASVTDGFGARDSATITLGLAPEPLALDVGLPARADAGEAITGTATPSRTSGVDVRWSIVAGPSPAGFPKTGRTITFDAPNVTSPQVVRLSVTAVETATGASATRELAVQVDAPPPLVVAAPPTVSVDPGAQASIEATVTGGAGATFSWRQTLGPDVALEGATSRTVRFRAPSTPGTIGLRFSADVGTVTRSTDTIVTIGAAAAPPPSGCGDGSVYRQLAQGGPVVIAGVAVISGGSTQGANASCDEATFDGIDVNLLDGLVIGDGLSGTFDDGGIRFTGGDVRLPDAFRLPPIDLGSSPLQITFPDAPGSSGSAPGGSGGSTSCITWDAGLASRDFPFVPLPPGFSGAGARVAISCNSATIAASATAGAATFAADATLADGGADATVTLTNVPALGGTASGSGSITVAPGGAPTYDVTATIANPRLPVPGISLATATARITPSGLTVAADGALGQGNAALAVSLEGTLEEGGLSLTVEASSPGPWAVGPALTVDAADLVGTIDVDATGATVVDLRVSAAGDWRPVAGLRVRQVALQVSNTAVPPDCAIPAGGMWVRVAGDGAIEIPGVAPLTLGVEACLGPPSNAALPAFSLRSTIGGPQWQVADGVVIRNVGIRVTVVGGALTLEASGGATLLGLDLTARVLFLAPTTGAPTIVVDASGSLAGLGVPITSGHVVFASAAVSDFALEPGLEVDLPQGITGVGTIDLGQPIADLLNDAFDPPTPILPRVTVTLSFGAAIEIKAAIDLGGGGATLFLGCPGGGTSCNPTAPTTTRLALDTAFIRLVLGGSGGFSVGFGGDGTLNLPPAETGGPASPLDLHIEASIQPPARVGLALFFEGQWQNAMGMSGLHLSNLGIQGSIDFSTTPIPTVTMGITGQVDRVPDPLANLLGLTNNGEPLRFTVNVDPLAPILEMTLGVDDGEIVMRPLTPVGQPDALEVDFASVVIAPLGGTVGAVTYSPGVSAGFGADIFDVPVHVNASVDLAAAHLNGTVAVGSLTVGGVRFEDTTILLDVTPQRFRQTLCGGVHVGSSTLQGLLHVQAGAGGGGLATCGGVNLDPGSATGGLRARFRLSAAALPVGPVTVQQLVVDAQANLDALSANFNATLTATARLNVLANSLDVDGTIKFAGNTLQELRVKARGNLSVGGVQITGDGSCPFGAPGTGSGACVQLEHAPATSTPFRLGLKGKLTAAGSTATVTGALDNAQASLNGTLAVPTLGSLGVSGNLVFGGGATIKNATGATVAAHPGDWRVNGQFGTPKTLAGGVSAAWALAAGRVSDGLFVRGSATTPIAGTTVLLAGTFNSSGSGNLGYRLTGASSGAVTGSTVNLATTGGGTVDVVHSALRTGVFNFPGLSPIGGRPSDERFPERMRGRLHFDASYDIAVTLTQNGLDIDEADFAARVVYGESFDRDRNGSFTEEAAGQRNTLVNFDLDAGGVDEFFEMAVADAASRTTAPTFCFGLFGNELGDC